MLRSATFKVGEVEHALCFPNSILVELMPESDADLEQQIQALFDRATNPRTVGELFRAGLEGHRRKHDPDGQPVSAEAAAVLLDELHHQAATKIVVRGLRLGFDDVDPDSEDEADAGKRPPPAS